MSTPPLSLYEYGTADFAQPLNAGDAGDLETRCAEMKSVVKGDVLTPIWSQGAVTGVRAQQFVGVVRINKNITIQVLPKMARGNDDAACDLSIQNLLYMLAYCKQLPAVHPSATALRTYKGDFFEILIYLYSSTLLSEIRSSLHAPRIRLAGAEPGLPPWQAALRPTHPHQQRHPGQILPADR
ncbi:MAG TPA: hypothetical protein VF572_00565 [Candidatus Saccharimonadales bacterium]|jgi:5-methylcytosine-specific restriction enzyme subunit McrC